MDFKKCFLVILNIVVQSQIILVLKIRSIVFGLLSSVSNSVFVGTLLT